MKEQLLSLLPAAHPWRDGIHWFDVIDSTNTEAKRLAQAGASHGTVLIADQQTGGRGRMGRTFSSPGGKGIYMSVILRPHCKANQLMHLTCAVAVAMCDAVESVTGFRPSVKWINDLIAKGKKLGGILTELSLIPGTDQVDYAIIGVGINCLQAQTDFPEELQDIAISLVSVTGEPVDRAELAAAMICSFDAMAHLLLTQKEGLMACYRRDCCTLGQDIYLIRGETKTPCHAVGLDPDGGLSVIFPDGTAEIVNSGEVSTRFR